MTPRQRVNRAKRRTAEKNAMLKGNKNKKAVARIYKENTALRATGQDTHVDHIIPIRAKLACGLTCPSNLQIITAEEDLDKGNEFRSFSKKHGVITYL
jgi:hypothetical protein